MTIAVLRTDDSRFMNLPDYTYVPHYVFPFAAEPALRMHFIDVPPVGTANGEVALCLHGQPTWSYLYRKMIPGLTAAGYRVVAPDLFGFGRSDKPVEENVYTFDFHRNSLMQFIQLLGLRQILLICQDWGGLLGLTIPMEMPDRFKSLLVMNTTLGTGDQPLPQGFLDWRAWNNKNPDMPIAALMKRSTPKLSDNEAAAYEAPFPDVRYKAGVRRFPNLVPDHPDAGGASVSRQARNWWSTKWSGRTAMAIGERDPVLGPPTMLALASVIRGCPTPIRISEGGHFVQENGDEVLRSALPLITQR